MNVEKSDVDAAYSSLKSTASMITKTGIRTKGRLPVPDEYKHAEAIDTEFSYV